MAPRASVASVLGAVLWAALSLSAHARTLPSEVDKLLALKVELEARGLSYLLDTWTCPDVGPCDPCGPEAGANNNWGQWHYVACRVVPDREYRAAVRAAGVAERRGSRRRYGLVTNVHLSDLAIEGTLDSMRDVLCPFTHLRELDIDGGRLTGGGRRFSPLDEARSSAGKPGSTSGAAELCRFSSLTVRWSCSSWR